MPYVEEGFVEEGYGDAVEARYLQLVLSDPTNPAGRLKGAVLWAGPLWSPDHGLTFETDFSEIKAGSPGVERWLRKMVFTLVGLTEAQKRAIVSIARSKLSTGRLLVIPRLSEGLPIAIGYHNLANGRVIEASSSDASYPATNLSDHNMIGSDWQSAAAAVSDVTLDVDVGNVLPLGVVALLGFNGTDAAVVTPKAGSVEGFATGVEWDPGELDAFDVSLPALLPDAPAFGRHLILTPALVADPSTWLEEAFLGTLVGDVVKRRMATATPLWQVSLTLMECED